MDNNYIEININGVIYYLQADRLQDLNYIDGKLVNTSNQSITLVNTFDYNNTYPRITCGAMSQCILRSNNTSNYSLVSSSYSIIGDNNINTLGTNGILSLIFFVLFIFLGLKLLWK